VAVVEAYAAAKSSRGCRRRVGVCADDAVFVTIPFQAVAREAAEAGIEPTGRKYAPPSPVTGRFATT
jgi:hypothetical protein